MDNEILENDTETNSAKGLSNRILVYVAVGIVILVVFYILIWVYLGGFKTYLTKDVYIENDTEESVNSNRANSPEEDEFGDLYGKNLLNREVLDGVIFLTLVPKEGIERMPKDPVLGTVSLWALDAKFLTRPRFTYQNNVAMTEHISPDGGRAVFAMIPWSGITNGIAQIFSIDRRNITKQITTSDTKFKRNPEWSPDGKLVTFMARGPDSQAAVPGIESADAWMIYVTDFEGKEIYIDNGTYPQWLPDSKNILYIKPDGLYIANIETGKKEMVFAGDSVEFPITTQHTLDVNKMGTKVAWSNPVRGEIRILSILIAEGNIKLSIDKTIDIISFFPTFSEDGKYLATQTYKNKLIVIDIEKEVYAVLSNLDDGFELGTVYITDWRIIDGPPPTD